MTGFPQVSDAFEANKNLGRRGNDVGVEDPRTPLQRLRIRVLQQMCADRGYPEALGTGVKANGDATGWTKDQCLKVLEANITADNRSRKVGDANKPLSVEEMDRTDLYGVLARDFGIIPPAGTDTEEMRKLYSQKMAERQAGLSAARAAVTAIPDPIIPVATAVTAVPVTEAPLPTADEVTSLAWAAQKDLANKLKIKVWGKKRDELVADIVAALRSRTN